jgi:hypothetical protein
MTLVPAYGRDYKSATEVKADWDADKDFRIQDISSPYDGSYINKQQAKAGDTFKIRYSKLKKFTIIKG